MKLAKVLAAVAVLGFVGMAMAQEAPKEKPKGLYGKIVKVEGTDVTVKTMARRGTEGKEVVVKTDDKTVVTIDGKDAKFADLKEGYFVRVTPAEGTATKIAARTKPREHKPAPAPAK
jgi:hypothetical protein